MEETDSCFQISGYPKKFSMVLRNHLKQKISTHWVYILDYVKHSEALPGIAL